ncbi:G-type lectin S-receptor-like serine/threonine-protein kinase CES101 [Tanacetum coccineum]|uniref:G-type lectin S-receptor-like serine/threonine-protein kinase CES101 n=1 Tax=Tanacetum coccineum TaxID=301880 RepID=A0ABQ5CCI7_9ASTR
MEGNVSQIDVFGFGVLLLETICGKMNHGSYDTEHPLNLLGLAWELWNEGRDSCTPKEVMTSIHVGLLCVQDHAIDRPTMSEVISMLTNENMHLPEPKQPAFFIERCDAEAARHDNLEKVTVYLSVCGTRDAEISTLTIPVPLSHKSGWISSESAILC